MQRFVGLILALLILSPTVHGICGDGVLDTGEECDDGNNIDTDFCSNNCTLNICGNNRTDPGEDCDIVPWNEFFCNIPTTPEGVRCKVPRCGDGYVQIALGEQCDDGNLILTQPSNCSLQCKWRDTYCGDGIVQTPNSEGVMEECDAGVPLLNFSSANSSCTAACRLPFFRAILRDNLVEILLLYREGILSGQTSCDTLFDASTASKLGPSPTCRIIASHRLLITLSELDATLLDDIRRSPDRVTFLRINVISLGTAFPGATSSDAIVPLYAPANPQPIIQIEYPPEIPLCYTRNRNATLRVDASSSYNLGRNFRVQWQVIEDPLIASPTALRNSVEEANNANQLWFEFSAALLGGNFTAVQIQVNLTLTNELATSSAQFSVSSMIAGAFLLLRSGPAQIVQKLGRDVSFTTEILNPCESADAAPEFSWSQTSGQVVVDLRAESQSSLSTHLRLPRSLLLGIPPDIYEWRLSATLNPADPYGTTRDTRQLITLLSDELVAVLEPASRMVSYTSDFTLDASQSADPDLPYTLNYTMMNQTTFVEQTISMRSYELLLFRWFCYEIANPSKACPVATQLQRTQSAMVTIRSRSIAPGDYIFGVEVSHNLTALAIAGVNWTATEKQPSNAIVQITLSFDPSAPQVLLKALPQTGEAWYERRMNVRRTVALDSVVSPFSQYYSYQWTVRSAALSPQELGEFTSSIADQLTSPGLTIPPNSLKPESTYEFALVVRSASGSTGFANFTLQTRGVPFGGKCQANLLEKIETELVAAQYGIPYELTCTEWNLPERSEGPPRYSVYAVVDEDDPILLGLGERFDNRFNLSVPIATARLLVRISDATGSFSEVSVALESPTQTIVSSPIDSVQTALRLGDQQQIGYALTNLLVAFGAERYRNATLSGDAVVSWLLQWVGPSPALVGTEAQLQLFLKAPVASISVQSSRAVLQWMVAMLNAASSEIYSEKLFRLFLELVDRYIIVGDATKEKTVLMETAFEILRARAFSKGEMVSVRVLSISTSSGSTGVILRRSLGTPVSSHPLRVSAGGTSFDLPPSLFADLLQKENVTVLDSVTRYFAVNPYSYARVPLPEQYCVSLTGLRFYRADTGAEISVWNRTAQDIILTQRSTKPRSVMSFEGTSSIYLLPDRGAWDNFGCTLIGITNQTVNPLIVSKCRVLSDYSAFIAKLYQPISPAPVVPRGKLEFTVNKSLLYLTPIGGVMLLLLVLWLAVRLSRDNTRQLFPGRGQINSKRPSHQEYFNDSNNDHLDAIPMRSLENTEYDHESVASSDRADAFANDEEQSVGSASAAPSAPIPSATISSPNKGKSLLANLSLDDSSVNSAKALLPTLSSNVHIY